MFLFIVLAFLIAVPTADAGWGFLTNNPWFATYAIDDYPDPEDDVDRAKITANAFYDRMRFQLYNRYRIIPTLSIKREDAAVTYNNWFTDDYNWCEFLFYYGHGTQGRISVLDNRYAGGMSLVDINAVPMGFYQKWAFIISCTALNRDLRSPFMPTNAFNGLHAMYGFKSLAYDFTVYWKPSRSWTYITGKTENWVYTFSDLWVSYNTTMWDAYKQSVYSRIYIECDVVGIAPAAFYVWKTLDGKSFEGHQETIKNVYSDPVPSSGAGMGFVSVAYGTPVYYIL